MVKIFADGADLATMERLAGEVDGFTTNPSLMRKAGITDYRAFGRAVLEVVGDKPVSFEVLADDIQTMERQAHELAGWGPNVYVKVPISTTKGEACSPLIFRLALVGVKVNVTAVFSKGHVREAVEALGSSGGILSVFAGRIADTGRDPMRVMNSARTRIGASGVQLLWASARQIYDVVQAEACGCQIITLTPELLAKRALLGKDLQQYSIETIQQFNKDAEGITL